MFNNLSPAITKWSLNILEESLYHLNFYKNPYHNNGWSLYQNIHHIQYTNDVIDLLTFYKKFKKST